MYIFGDHIGPWPPCSFVEIPLQQLMRNGFKLRNLYIVCVLFGTIENLIKQLIGCNSIRLCMRKEGNVLRENNDEEHAVVVEHFDKKEEIVFVSHICSKGVACVSNHLLLLNVKTKTKFDWKIELSTYWDIQIEFAVLFHSPISVDHQRESEKTVDTTISVV